MSKQNIYPVTSQEVLRFFSHNVPLEKLLIVPFDFAKSEHTVHCCRGTGEFLLKHPLRIFNTVEGADYLEKRIQGLCRKYHISRSHVLLGGEDPPNYVINFIHYLKDRRFSFVRVNAHEAKKFRTNNRASPDAIDLNGIARAILNRRAGDIAQFDEIYTNLKGASRNRRKLVKQETAIKNQIHKSVDLLFPNFLSERQTGMVPFSSASLHLMEENFSLIKIKRMKMESLIKGLRRHRSTKAEETAGKLKELADRVLAPPSDLIAYTSNSLSSKVKLLKTVRESIFMEETEMARFLVQTPGFYLTTIPGIGVVLAGGIVAEYGNVGNWLPVDNMASYGGIVPREKQSGGSDKLPVKGHLPLDCNRILKDWLLQGAFHVGTTEHPIRKIPGKSGTHRLLKHYQHVENRQGKSRLSTAKLLIKVFRRMAVDQRIYLPDEWVNQPAESDQELFLYLDVINKTLKDKWKAYDLSGIDGERNYYLKWKDYCNDLKQFDSE